MSESDASSEKISVLIIKTLTSAAKKGVVSKISAKYELFNCKFYNTIIFEVSENNHYSLEPNSILALKIY